MIRTEALTKYYGSRCAVRDLDLEIDTREIVGFLGLNGAGKTTTLRMLAGLLAPSSGRILIDGEELDATASGSVRWRIGFLPERPPVYDDMTVHSFLVFAAQLHGVSPANTEGGVGEVIELCELEDYRDAPIRSLSHGFKQRVGIAQAVVHEPALVILDEPISGLDPVQIRHMRDLIRNLKDKHTVLLSSHNLPEIQQTCDRLLVIRDGQLAHSGTEADLSAQAEGKGSVTIEVGASVDALREAIAGDTSLKLVGGIEAKEGKSVATVQGAADQVAQVVVKAGLPLFRLEPEQAELESLFEELTRRAS